MGKSANVTSLEAMREFKHALIRFAEEATRALDSFHQEIYQALDWLEHDRPHYWRAQVRKSYDRVAQTRTELEKARLRTVAGHRPSCYDEKKALELAKQRLETAREKVETVKRWAVAVRDEADEFRGRLGALGRSLEIDIPKTLAMLERSISALEAYVEIQGAPEELPDPAAPSDAPSESSAQ